MQSRSVLLVFFLLHSPALLQQAVLCALKRIACWLQNNPNTSSALKLAVSHVVTHSRSITTRFLTKNVHLHVNEASAYTDQYELTSDKWIAHEKVHWRHDSWVFTDFQTHKCRSPCVKTTHNFCHGSATYTEQPDQHQVLYTVWHIHCLHMGMYTHITHAEEAHKLPQLW